MDVLNDLNNGVYERTMIQQSSSIKPNQTNRDHFKPNNGKIIYQDNIIRYENVPLATPVCNTFAKLPIYFSISSYLY